MVKEREECWPVGLPTLLSLHHRIMTEKCQRIVEPGAISNDPSLQENMVGEGGGPNHPKNGW